MSLGKLVIFTGPTGVGKETILEAWRKVNPRVRRVVFHTTRKQRDGEVEGTDYHFVSKEVFEKLLQGGAFLEHREVFGNHYGASKAVVDGMVGRGLIAILKADVQDGSMILDQHPEAIPVFVLPPNLQALEDRIRSSGLDSPEETEQRLSNAQRSLAYADRYQFRLVNDHVQRVVEQLQEIVNG